MMSIAARAVLAVCVTAALASGCHDLPTESPTPVSQALVISDTSDAHAAASGFQSAANVLHSESATSDVAYVSMPPGSTTGTVVQIRNLRTGAIADGVIIEGGFDPLGVPARAGDSLETRIARAGGETVAQFTTVVPTRRRPRIVRTIPPRNKRGVPLNALLSVVFSEPIDPSSTTKVLRLMRGATEVLGRVEVRDLQAMTIDFVPDADLDASTTYQLIVSEGLRDRDGDLLEGPFAAEFVTGTTTASAATSGPVRVILPMTGVHPDRNGYVIRLGDQFFQQSIEHQHFEKPNQHAYFNSVPAGDHLLTVDDVAPNCTAADNPRTVTVSGPDETRVTVNVNCVASHGLRARVVTSGEEPDTDGYIVTAWRMDFEMTEAIDKDPFEVYGLVYGEYFLRLRDVAGNCSVVGQNPRRVVVPDSGVGETTFEVACSASGRIAYAENSNQSTPGSIENVDIYVVRPSGLGRTRLTTHAALDRDPVWSPNGALLAFATDRDGNDEIYVMAATGSNPTRLTDDPAADNQPAWSPDGSRIAFVSARDGNADIYVMNADGTGVTRLTNHEAADQYPSWSPDSRKIVFRSDRTGHGQIYSINADGSGLLRLTVDGMEDTDPAWSPDGKRILFTRIRFCGRLELDFESACQSTPMLMNADGSNVAPLNALTPRLRESMGRNPGGADYRSGSWSPDGTKIVFAVAYCGWDGDCHLEEDLWIVDVATGEATRLGPASAGYDFDARKRFPSKPAWTP